jgi:hypothetical protein
MDELKNEAYRNKLAELVFDLEKLTPSLKSAEDCVTRLEKSWINTNIQCLRDELKNAESVGKDPILIMKQIEELQSRINSISYQYSPDE